MTMLLDVSLIHKKAMLFDVLWYIQEKSNRTSGKVLLISGHHLTSGICSLQSGKRVAPACRPFWANRPVVRKPTRPAMPTEKLEKEDLSMQCVSAILCFTVLHNNQGRNVKWDSFTPNSHDNSFTMCLNEVQSKQGRFDTKGIAWQSRRVMTLIWVET